ncbi:MAG TPA: hypothetical protein VFJ17_05605 [Mycobacteriales bacterium]|nr:hypothetical protein [Mycobacteriales bacterium]
MRWARLFDDLDAQVEAAERAERSAESADLRRLELSRLALSERLAAAEGVQVTVTVEGADPLTGAISRVGAEWLLLQEAAGGETLVSAPAVVAVTGLPVASIPSTDEVDRRLGIGVVLRQLARDRAPVAVATRSGAVFTGTIDRVGVDHVDLAEHAADRPRRASDVLRVRTIATAAISFVRPA